MRRHNMALGLIAFVMTSCGPSAYDGHDSGTGDDAADGAVAGSGGRGGQLGGGTGGTHVGAGGAAGVGGAGSGGNGSGGRLGSGGSGSGGSGSGGVSGSGGGCGVAPVTPDATAKTRSALCYLYQIYGKKILAGQEENNDDNAMSYILSNTGKVPAIRAFDVNNSKAPAQCVAHAQKNGLCMFGYHMGIVNGDGYTSSMTKTDINQVLTESSAYNTTFKQRLDKTAAMIKIVQDADGVAIMRPFHEAGGTWFWWSMEGGAQYVRVWKYAFDYLTRVKGLHNMIWMLPYNGSPNASFYPGKAWVDIGGADTYAGDGKYDPQSGLYKACAAIFGASMPIGLHECGPIPDPVQLQSTGSKWVLFNVWTAPFYQAPSNSVAHLQAVYGSDYVVTRDEMGGF